MNNYFIRHTNVLAIDDTELNKIWAKDLIAIHFPNVKRNDGKLDDTRSLNSHDYTEPGDKHAVERFVTLAREGGYVWAQYHTQNDIKVGIVKPGSEIKLWTSFWSSDKYPYRSGKEAILKTLQLSNVRIIKSSSGMSLRAARPRQGTVITWPSAGNRLEALILGSPIDQTWDNLSPDLQETVCAEYLRNHQIEGLPRLSHLLMPTGRTLKDIDIYGYADNGTILLGQVTFTKKDYCKEKIECLKQYNPGLNHLVFFCNCGQVEKDEDIWFIPTKLVFEWLVSNKNYADKVFSA